MRRLLQSGHLSMLQFQLLKLYLELTIYRCINDEHTPKNGDFNKKKNDESIL